MVTLLGAVN